MILIQWRPMFQMPECVIYRLQGIIIQTLNATFISKRIKLIEKQKYKFY